MNQYTLIDVLKKKSIRTADSLITLWELLDQYTKNYKAVVITNAQGDIIAGNVSGYSYSIGLGKSHINQVMEGTK